MTDRGFVPWDAGTDIRGMRELRKKKTRIRAAFAGLVLMLALIAAGCGVKYSEPDLSKGSLTLGEDGSVELSLKRSFTEAYYSEEELLAYTNGMIADYNNAHGGEKIALRACGVKDGTAELTLFFTSWEDYAAFMPTALYVGTVQGALAK